MTNHSRRWASSLISLFLASSLLQALAGCGSDVLTPSGPSNANTTGGGSATSARAGGGATLGGPSGGGGTTPSPSEAGSTSNFGGTGGAPLRGDNSTGGLFAAGNSTGGSNVGGSAAGGFGTGGSVAAKGGSGGSGIGGTGTAGLASDGTAFGGAATGGMGVSTGGSLITGLATPASVLEAMQRANSYFVARWPDPTQDIVTDKTRPSNLWTRAIYYEGLMGLYSIEPDSTKRTAYYNYTVAWASSPSHPYTMTYTAAATMTNNADNQACGQTYIDLYRIDPQPERIAVIKANIDDMVTKNTADVWTWIDAIQMSMPVFAKLGKTLTDTKYFDAMWSLYAHARNTQGGGLFNTTEGLWWRDWHFTPSGGTKQTMTATLNNAVPPTTTDAYIVAPNGKNLYWSRGNAWVMAALVRVLDELPSTDPHLAQYISDFQAMAAALLPIQRSDGFWPESLADPSHCATIGIANQDGPETSGTALFVYGLAWGIRNGLLASTTYGSALVKAWNGLVTTALQSNGLLGYVQNTGDRPCTGPAPLAATTLANFDDYGVGCFLLAGTEIYRLSSNEYARNTIEPNQAASRS